MSWNIRSFTPHIFYGNHLNNWLINYPKLFDSNYWLLLGSNKNPSVQPRYVTEYSVYYPSYFHTRFSLHTFSTLFLTLKSTFASRSILALSLSFKWSLSITCTRYAHWFLKDSPAHSLLRSFHSSHFSRWLVRVSIGSPLPHQKRVTLFNLEKKILSLGEHVLVHLQLFTATRCMPAFRALPLGSRFFLWQHSIL